MRWRPDYERAAAMRVKAEEVRAIGSITESSEKTESRLKELEDNQTVEARLGSMLMKRNIKIGEGACSFPCFARDRSRGARP